MGPGGIHRQGREQWAWEAFIAKGGLPKAAYPIPMVLGNSVWMVKHSPSPEAHGEIRIPLSVFAEHEINFTSPDSMISFWRGREKPADLYQAAYHGMVVTLSEILELVESKGRPEEAWEPRLPPDMAPYIEAQVWNHEPLRAYKQV